MGNSNKQSTTKLHTLCNTFPCKSFAFQNHCFICFYDCIKLLVPLNANKSNLQDLGLTIVCFKAKQNKETLESFYL